MRRYESRGQQRAARLLDNVVTSRQRRLAALGQPYDPREYDGSQAGSEES